MEDTRPLKRKRSLDIALDPNVVCARAFESLLIPSEPVLGKFLKKSFGDVYGIIS